MSLTIFYQGKRVLTLEIDDDAQLARFIAEMASHPDCIGYMVMKWRTP